MYLNDLSVHQYRNLADLQLDFDSQVNIFIGANGQGKTNLLEAIYLTTITRSFKTNKLADLVKFNESLFYVKASIFKKNFPYFIEITYDGKKKFKVNNNNESKFKDIMGLLNAVLFVAEDVTLLKDSPKQRRKLFDIELSKLYPEYLYSLSSYYNLLKQRNGALKSDVFDEVMLKTFNQQLEHYGILINDHRSEFVKRLEKLTLKFYHYISGCDDEIKISYITNIYKDNLSFLQNLDKSMTRDLINQQTNVGIHRDDFIVYLNDKNAALYASQGEQRTIVLAIKLALVEYIYEEINEYPILLLDDVMSELDVERQNNLLRYLNEKVQTFITTTDIKKIDSNYVNCGKVFEVSNGFIKEEVINDK